MYVSIIDLGLVILYFNCDRNSTELLYIWGLLTDGLEASMKDMHK